MEEDVVRKQRHDLDRCLEGQSLQEVQRRQQGQEEHSRRVWQRVHQHWRRLEEHQRWEGRTSQSRCAKSLEEIEEEAKVVEERTM